MASPIRPACDTPAEIRRLCIALAHRWEPERLFVILTAYLDESGTHGGSPLTIMSGFLGTARQWDRWEKDFGRLRNRYGFTVFHSKEFRDNKGEFKGWTINKRAALQHEMYTIMHRHLGAGFIVTLKNEEYETIYKPGIPPRKIPLDTKYGIVFRASVAVLLQEWQKRMRPGKPHPALNIVMEHGAKNAGDAVRLYDWMTREVKREYAAFFDGLAFKKKPECHPLAMADFMAHLTFKYESDMLKPPDQQRDWGMTKVRKQHLYKLAIGPEQLRMLRDKRDELEADRLTKGMRTIRPDLAGDGSPA